MNIITFLEPITVAFRKSAGGVTHTFEANRPYLLANAQVERIMRDQQVQARTYKVSRADARIPNANVGAMRRGQRVLLFNGSGGYGDQIMTWPVAKFLSTQGFDVHVLTDPGNNVCWWNFDWVKTVQTVPLPWDTVRIFDHFMLWEAVVNMDEHPDQMHPVDAMFYKIGVDPMSVPDADKVVRPVFTPGEIGAGMQHLRRDKRTALYQLSSANPVRCMSSNDSVFLAIKLAEAIPDTHWLCLYDEFVPATYKDTLVEEAKKRGLTNIEPFTAPNLRELWVMTEHVSAVVSPDSMMAHISGTLGTPCVGLWGPMSPVSRVKYYTNHAPIWHKEYCPHSPCFVYSNTFPKFCPPRPAQRNACDVIAGISPQEVIDMVLKVRR